MIVDPSLLLVVGGLFALLLGHEIFSDDDAPSRSENPDGDGDDVVTEYDSDADADGVLATGGGNDLVRVPGTIGNDIDLGAGNDTIEGVSVVSPTSASLVVRGGEGDDAMSLDLAERAFVYGGEGADLIEIGHFSNRIGVDEFGDAAIVGGAGNDTIIIDDADANSSFAGDDGDDLIVVDGSGQDEQGYLIEGGTGDDTIQLIGATGDLPSWIGVPQSDDAGAGEAGSDTLEISVRITDAASNLAHLADNGLADDYADASAAEIMDALSRAPSLYNAAVEVLDFDPAQDRLVIDPTTYAGDATYAGFEIVDDLIVLHYSSPDHPEGMSVAISVDSSSPLTADQIRIVGSLPDRTAQALTV